MNVFIYGLLDMGVTEVLSLCAKNTDLSDTLGAEAYLSSQQMHNMALHRDFQNQG